MTTAVDFSTETMRLAIKPPILYRHVIASAQCVAKAARDGFGRVANKEVQSTGGEKSRKCLAIQGVVELAGNM